MQKTRPYYFLFAFLLAACSAAAAWGQTPKNQTGQQTAAGKRTLWTTSRMVGSPEAPPPYRVEPAFPALHFQRPVAMTSAPGTERLFVAEQGGKIYSFPNDGNADTPDLTADLKLLQPKLGAIYGLTFHPQFEQNGFVYVCYILNLKDKEHATRVSRFKVLQFEPPMLDLATEKVLITWRAGGHNGGCLKFGPDGYLYISTGDASPPTPPDIYAAGQDLGSLLSSLLRIDVDHDGNNQSGNEQGDSQTPYRIPADNPFVETDGARGEIWSYGFRNPWKFSFDRQTGDLWLGDVGWELWEMIYRVQKGGNYGWSIMEGPQPVHPEGERGPTPIEPPLLQHPHSEASSITGGFVYRGSMLKKLAGAYIYGDYQTGLIWGAKVEGDKIVWSNELARTPLQLVGFGEDRSGELYLLDYRGQIYRLAENEEVDNSQNFPRKLSETGLFSSVADHTPAAGVVPYQINAEHWADHTYSRRWLAAPGGGQLKIGPKGDWQFPDGSVLLKTVSIALDANTPRPTEKNNAALQNAKPRKERRLETQLLHRESGSWRPYTYVWNADQTDAELADRNGVNLELKIRDSQAPGGVREQTYRVAGRRECILCHNPWVQSKTTVFGVQTSSPLAINTRQLNCSRNGDDDSPNQLSAWQRTGLLASNLSESPKDLPTLVDPTDASADLDARVRAYLQVNCAHCHQFNAGGAATISLSYDVKLQDTNTLNVRPTQGMFGIADAKIIAPGDPLGSVLFYRLAKLGGGRMPRVGTREVDVRAVNMIYDWIAQLPAGKPTPEAAKRRRTFQRESVADVQVLRSHATPDAQNAAIGRLASSTRGALTLLRLLDAAADFQGDDSNSGAVNDAVRKEIIALAGNHHEARVRDLFERFLPAAQRVKRLGEVVNPAEILSLPADAEQGRRVFFQHEAAACKNCHRIQDKGETLGPDLSLIGRKYRPDQLLEHVLDPSKLIEPKYVAYLLETTAGRILSGLLVSQTDAEVVLRDTKNQLHRIPVEQVELLVRQQKSLMPELLLKEMTREEVANLIAFLASLK